MSEGGVWSARVELDDQIIIKNGLEKRGNGKREAGTASAVTNTSNQSKNSKTGTASAVTNTSNQSKNSKTGTASAVTNTSNQSKIKEINRPKK